MDNKGIEKRKDFRVSVARPVVILLSSGKKVHAMISNISITGIGVLSHVPGEVNAELTFLFSLTIKQKAEKFALRGKIVHSFLRADKYQSGIQFIGATPDVKKRLIEFISEVKNKRVS